MTPCIHQNIGGPVSKAVHAVKVVGRQHTDIGNSTQIQNHPMDTDAWNNAWWNPKTKGAPCPPAAISRRRKSETTGELRDFSDDIWITNLQGKAMFRAMANGLPMRTDSLNFLRSKLFFNQFINTLTNHLCQKRHRSLPIRSISLSSGKVSYINSSRSSGSKGTVSVACSVVKAQMKLRQYPHHPCLCLSLHQYRLRS